MDLKDLQNQMNEVMDEQNNRSISEFEGYSPYEMHHILHFTFDANSPISLQKLSDLEYKKIPLLNQVKYFLGLIREWGEIKLTAKGYLPTKIVKEIYNQEFLEDLLIDTYKYQVYKESDSMTVNLTRILCEISGLIKKRNGKLSLTKYGEKISSNDFNLFGLIFKTMATKFNWAYYDGYGDNQIGQLGFGFSLILLSKYGNTKHPDNFYAKKYLNAFPSLKETESSSHFASPQEQAEKCYSLRTFDRFLDYFGLIKIETVGKKWDPDKYITKTDMFDKLIKVRPHGTQYRSTGRA